MKDQITFFKNKKNKSQTIPLAEKMRPATLDEIVGQEKLLAKNSILHSMITRDKYSSFIMWGPPGTGKTTIARIIAQKSQNNFIAFSAVLTSIKDVKKTMKEAEYLLQHRGISTIVFIDEIHRFNKAQQDAFLPYIESGAIILIGATTENPSFEVIPALLSRCQVLVLEKLSDENIVLILQNAVNKLELQDKFSDEIIEYLSSQSEGDARKALNYLEIILSDLTPKKDLSLKQITKILQKKTMYYDKDREEHYNLISALHKSLRGSDAQAGLYWTARMLEAGEDPMYVVRRLVRFASEDIGLADTNALKLAIAVKDAVHFLGMPEANTAIAQLVIYLATAPKSNSVYKAYKNAAKEAKNTSHLGVPLHIRNAPTQLMKNLGYGENYKYAHDYKNAYIYQNYFPEKLSQQTFYHPSNFGFEKEIKKRLDWWEKLKNQEKEDK